MKILAIYDNGGKTIDRYTVVTDLRDKGMYEMLGVAASPGGFSQWSTGFYYSKNNRHLGKRVHFEDLSEELQEHIARRLWA